MLVSRLHLHNVYIKGSNEILMSSANPKMVIYVSD